MKHTEFSHPHAGRLVFLGALMDLCWLCALGNYLVISTTPSVFPLKGLAAAYAGSALLTGIFKTSRWRMIWPFLAHIAGICLAGALILSSVGIPLHPQDPFQWYEAGLLGCMTVIFWYKGFRLARRRWTYFFACNHFDTGFAFLFGLLCVKLLIHAQSNIQIPDALIVNAILLYFLCGAAALFIAGSPSGARKEFSGDFRVFGTLLTAAVLILSCGAGLVLVFKPVMTTFAGTGYSLLKQGAAPFGPPLLALLRFILLPRSTGNDRTSASAGDRGSYLNITAQDSPDAWWETALIYGLTGLVCSILVLAAAWLLIILFRYLFSRRLPASEEKPAFLSFLSFLGLLMAWAARLKNRISRIFITIHTAGQIYERLVLWGERSGVMRRCGETPGEYADRLCMRFHPVHSQIRLILYNFELELYAGRQIDPGGIRKARSALKQLHHPSLWWLRLKSRMISG